MSPNMSLRLAPRPPVSPADGFEHFVADLRERFGWKYRVVGKSRDHGIEVVATTPDGERQLIRQNATTRTRRSGTRRSNKTRDSGSKLTTRWIR